MDDGPPAIVIAIVEIVVFSLCIWFGCSHERDKWCEYVHEKHSAVERCQDAPDYEREGD